MENVDIKKTIIFLLKSEEFKIYESEFKKLLNIKNNEIIEEKPDDDINNYEKLETKISKLQQKRLKIVKKYSKETNEKIIEKLEAQKTLVDYQIQDFNNRIDNLKIVIFRKELERTKISFLNDSKLPIEEKIKIQAKILKEKEYNLWKLIINKYFEVNPYFNYQEKKIINEDKYNLWAKDFIKTCNEFYNEKNNINLLSDIVKTLILDVSRNKKFLLNENIDILKNIDLTDKQENLEDSMNESYDNWLQSQIEQENIALEEPDEEITEIKSQNDLVTALEEMIIEKYDVEIAKEAT